jgi:putative ABC transport system substrate-binding protein
MKMRRKLLALIALGALPVFPSVAQQGKVWRLGILSIRPRPISLDSDSQYGPFLKGLRELGYIEGKNLAIEWRFAHGQYELLPVLAAELVRLKVDVIAVVNVPVIRAAQRVTKTIPIVMLTSSDPVGAEFVASLARPGGNITGLSNINVDLNSKYLEFLTVIIPKLSTAAFLLNPANSSHRVMLRNIQATAAKAGIKTLPMEAATPQQLESAFAAAAKERAGAIIVGADTLFLELRQKIVDLTFRYRMPSMFSQRLFVEAGGLMSYGQDFADNYRHAATYVDKILKGAKPADLPVELATKLQLVINRKTATALGLTISPELLLRADEVIE